MSFLNSLFGSSDPKDNSQSAVAWHPLTSLKQLDEIIESSREKPALIFKHSTRCGISRMVLKRFESEFGQQEKIDAYFLDLLSHRDISNEIASRFGVVHQSPQLLVIKDGISVYDTSHDSIDAGILEKFI